MSRAMALGKSIKKRWDQDWKPILVCFFIAFFLWFFQSMGKEYTADLQLAVDYQNQPEGKTLSNQPPEYFNIKVQGMGWDLLAYNLRINKPEYQIDLKRLGKEGRVSTSQVKDLMVESLPGLSSIISIEPTELNIELDDLAVKTVPVASGLKLELKQGYGITGGVSLQPDSVTIKGPASKVSQIEKIYTDSTTLTDVDEIVDIKLPLAVNDEHLSIDSNLIRISAKVERLTEKELQIPIKVIGYRGKQKVSVIPRMVTIYCQTTLGNFNKIDESDFNAFIDLSGVETESSELLPIQLETESELAKNIRLRPRYVDFFFEN